MLDHVTIGVSDRPVSRRFYETVLAPLGHEIASSRGYDEWNDFGLEQARSERPATRGLHVAFAARSRRAVDAFWRAGVEAGYASDGKPGPRPQYSPDYYGGFLLDPDGNSAEAVHHARPRTRGNAVDHLWIRVGDLDAARPFYEAIASVLGLEIWSHDTGRFHVAGGEQSFALVQDGRKTDNAHLAFTARDDASVRAFHEALVGAGFRDNGPPGERVYHAGYYAAYVLDPDGNNVEAVHHGR